MTSTRSSEMQATAVSKHCGSSLLRIDAGDIYSVPEHSPPGIPPGSYSQTFTLTTAT